MLSKSKIQDGTTRVYWGPLDNAQQYLNNNTYLASLVDPSFGLVYKSPLNWPKVNAPIELPRTVNIFLVTNNLGTSTHARYVAWKTLADKLIVDFINTPNLYINYFLFATPARFLQYLVPRQEDMPNKYLGTDPLFIIIYQDMQGGNAYAQSSVYNGLFGGGTLFDGYGNAYSQATRDGWYNSDKNLIRSIISSFRNYGVYVYFDAHIPDDAGQLGSEHKAKGSLQNPDGTYTTWTNFDKAPNVGETVINLYGIGGGAWEVSWLQTLCSEMNDIGFVYKGSVDYSSASDISFQNDIKNYYGIT